MGGQRIDYPSPGEFVRYVLDRRDEIGCPPSVREIAGHYEISTTAAHEMVRRLIEDGYIARPEGYARSLIITDTGLRAMEAAR